MKNPFQNEHRQLCAASVKKERRDCSRRSLYSVAGIADQTRAVGVGRDLDSRASVRVFQAPDAIEEDRAVIAGACVGVKLACGNVFKPAQHFDRQTAMRFSGQKFVRERERLTSAGIFVFHVSVNGLWRVKLEVLSSAKLHTHELATLRCNVKETCASDLRVRCARSAR